MQDGKRRVDEVTAAIEDCIPALRRYAWALVRSRQDADDLVHDCLVRALDRIGTRNRDGGMRPWLFAIMHNQFISNIRRERRRGRVETIEENDEALGAQAPRQEDLVQLRELVQALDRLSDEHRSVLLLISVEDFTYAEAAEVLKIPMGTVMSRLARGRERLREMLEGDARPVLRRVK